MRPDAAHGPRRSLRKTERADEAFKKILNPPFTTLTKLGRAELTAAVKVFYSASLSVKVKTKYARYLAEFFTWCKKRAIVPERISGDELLELFRERSGRGFNQNGRIAIAFFLRPYGPPATDDPRILRLVLQRARTWANARVRPVATRDHVRALVTPLVRTRKRDARNRTLVLLFATAGAWPRHIGAVRWTHVRRASMGYVIDPDVPGIAPLYLSPDSDDELNVVRALDELRSLSDISDREDFIFVKTDIYDNEYSAPLTRGGMGRVLADLCSAAKLPKFVAATLRCCCTTELGQAGLRNTDYAALVGSRDMDYVEKHNRPRWKRPGRRAVVRPVVAIDGDAVRIERRSD